MRILRYLSHCKGAVVLIVVLLIVQAFAELSLPQFTSDLVDVGIQQEGIEDASPDQMRESTFNAVCMLASESDEELIRNSYTQADDGTYVITDEGEQARDELNTAMDWPMAIVYFANQNETSSDSSEDGNGSESFNLEDLVSAYQAGAVSKDDVLSLVDEAKNELSGVSDSVIDQQAIEAVAAEYDALGLDTASIQMRYLVRMGIQMLLMTLLMAAAAISVGYVASRTAAKVARSLREKLFAKVLSFSDAEIQKFSAASLITRGTNDIQQIQMVMVMVLRMVIYSPILAIGGIIMVSTTNVAMSWIIALAVIVIFIIFGTLMVIAMPKFKIMQKLIDRVNLVAREMLTGLPVIKAFGRQDYEAKRFDDASTNLYRTQLFTNRVMSFMMPSMMLVMNAISVLIVWVGGSYIDQGVIQTGDLIAFITYSMVVIMSFLMIGMMAIMLPRADVAAERVNEVLTTENSIHDPESAEASLSTSTIASGQSSEVTEGEKTSPSSGATFDAQSSGIDETNQKSAEAAGDSAGIADNSSDNQTVLRSGGARIEFRDVTFAYDKNSKPVLNDINFVAEPGKTLAIIGSTGSGKSTILKLIERFYDVDRGAVLFDGVDVRDLNQHDLRSQIGYVPQKAFLFSGTIADTIRYGAPDASDEEVERAADIAQASDFILEKDEGFDSPVSEGGTNVSGGQRQRLSIARALATSARVYLFDDSFSALDYATDARLRSALTNQLGEVTRIIVAQRISTVIDADLIVVLDDGNMVGRGTHTELLQTCPPYREIAESQLSQAEIARTLSKAQEDASADDVSADGDDSHAQVAQDREGGDVR